MVTVSYCCSTFKSKSLLAIIVFFWGIKLVRKEPFRDESDRSEAISVSFCVPKNCPVKWHIRGCLWFGINFNTDD